MVQVLVEEDALRLVLGLVLGTQLADLAIVHGPCGLGCWVHRYQVHNSGDDHQKCQDGTDDDGCQVELWGAGSILPRNNQHKYDEHSYKGYASDGDDEALASFGIHLCISIAIRAAATTATAKAAAAAPKAAAKAATASIGAAIT